MANKWNYKYGNHTISVENNALSEILYIDGEIAVNHRSIFVASSELQAKLPEGQVIKARIVGTFELICELTIDDALQTPISVE